MAALKYSRQREAIKEFLATRKDHPTADVVYQNIREIYPHISLGTVYRNLTLLSDIGEILRLHLSDGVDHFDADTSLHYHFICKDCGSVIDLEMDSIAPASALTVSVAVMGVLKPSPVTVTVFSTVPPTAGLA